jgi:hypothetical protein
VIADTVCGSSNLEDCPLDTEEEGEVVGEPEKDECDEVESYKCNNPMRK